MCEQAVEKTKQCRYEHSAQAHIFDQEIFRMRKTEIKRKAKPKSDTKTRIDIDKIEKKKILVREAREKVHLFDLELINRSNQP
jgi:hypothetical protein